MRYYFTPVNKNAKVYTALYGTTVIKLILVLIMCITKLVTPINMVFKEHHLPATRIKIYFVCIYMSQYLMLQLFKLVLRVNQAITSFSLSIVHILIHL